MPFKDKAVRIAKQRTYARNWYLKNKEATKARVKASRIKSSKQWETYKSKQKCSHCGFSHPAAIDFHHVVTKNKQSVHYLASVTRNVSAAIREAETKCIPLCANCHRIHHWKQRKY